MLHHCSYWKLVLIPHHTNLSLQKITFHYFMYMWFALFLQSVLVLQSAEKWWYAAVFDVHLTPEPWKSHLCWGGTAKQWPPWCDTLKSGTLYLSHAPDELAHFNQQPCMHMPRNRMQIKNKRHTMHLLRHLNKYVLNRPYRNFQGKSWKLN